MRKLPEKESFVERIPLLSGHRWVGHWHWCGQRKMSGCFIRVYTWLSWSITPLQGLQMVCKWDGLGRIMDLHGESNAVLLWVMWKKQNRKPFLLLQGSRIGLAKQFLGIEGGWDVLWQSGDGIVLWRGGCSVDNWWGRGKRGSHYTLDAVSAKEREEPGPKGNPAVGVEGYPSIMAKQDPHHCKPWCKALAFLSLYMDEMIKSVSHAPGTILKRCPLPSRSSLSGREHR